MYQISSSTLLSVSPSQDSEEEGEGVRARDGAFGQREDRHAAAAGRAEERAQPVHGCHRDRSSPPTDHPAGGRPGVHVHRLRYRDEIQQLSSTHFIYIHHLHTWHSVQSYSREASTADKGFLLTLRGLCLYVNIHEHKPGQETNVVHSSHG